MPGQERAATASSSTDAPQGGGSPLCPPSPSSLEGGAKGDPTVRGRLAPELEGGGEPGRSEASSWVCFEEEASAWVCFDDAPGLFGGVGKMKGEPKAPSPAGSPTGVHELGFFHDKSECAQPMSGVASFLNTSKEELEKAFQAETTDDSDAKQNAASPLKDPPAPKSSARKLLPRLEGVQKWLSDAAAGAMDRGERTIFDRHKNKEEAARAKEAMMKDAIYNAVGASVDAMGTCGDDALTDFVSKSLTDRELARGVDISREAIPERRKKKEKEPDYSAVEADMYDTLRCKPLNRILDAVEDALANTLCFNDDGEECDLSLAVTDASSVREREEAPTVQQLDAVKTRNVGLQRQLSSTTRLLTTLQKQNRQLLRELEKQHHEREREKDASSAALSALRDERDAARERAVAAQQRQADASEADAASTLEAAGRVRAKIRESGRRLELDGLAGGPGGGDAGGAPADERMADESMAQLEHLVNDYCALVEVTVGRLRQRVSYRRRRYE